MKHSDFTIGCEFEGSAGFRWRCTDVGTRTIAAIQLTDVDPRLCKGPPYLTRETVFDEHEMERCHVSRTEAIKAALLDTHGSGHPGYPSEVVIHMLETRYKHRYPNDGVLRFDRRRADGEILHPYAGRSDGGRWIIELYLPFRKAYDQMDQGDFIDLPIATESDLSDRAKSG